MKKLLFLIFVVSYAFLNAQEKPDLIESDDSLYLASDITEIPSFANGRNEYQKYLMFNLAEVKPLERRRVNIIVYFVVEKNGSIDRVVIPRKYSKLFSEENFLRIIKTFKNMPSWIPGKKENEVKRVRMAQPITIN